MASRLRMRFTVALLGAFAACAGCAAERREVRSVSDFTAIALSAPLKLELAQGDRDSLELVGDERALAEIEAVVEDHTLRLRLRNRLFLSWNYKVRAIVTARRIAALTIDGSGDIVAGKLRADALKISIVGSGDARIGELAASSLEIAIKGSGDVHVSGKADAVAASIAGSGDIKAGKLEARRVKVAIAGSGDATVWSREALTASVAGSGDVRYYGDPAVEKTVLGSGSVRRLGPVSD